MPIHAAEGRLLGTFVHKWMGARLDGRVQQTGAVYEAKFMLPWNFSGKTAAEEYIAQLQHNMWVVAACRLCFRSSPVVEWMDITVHADPLYQDLLLTAVVLHAD
jgi:hypothetical protein